MQNDDTFEKLADRLIGALPAKRPGLFNPYLDTCEFDSKFNGPQQRRARLIDHLTCIPKLILVGEAPGYQGCRYTGVAFTSERLILDGAIPRIGQGTDRLSTRARPFSEPSATIIWKTLYQHRIQDEVVLWNALQLHPFRTGEPHSNRTPTRVEVAMGAEAMRILVRAYPRAKIVAIGKKAQELLGDMGVETVGAVRHPANGGATEFAAGIARLVKK